MEFNPIYEKLFLQAKKKTGQKEFSEPNVFMPAPTPPQGLESYPYLRKAYMETTTPSNFGY